MKANQENYRRLGRSAWLGTDHLLVVNTRFFKEHHIRLYRGDIESMMLYSLRRNQGTLLLFEWVCALVPLVVCAYLWWSRQPHGIITRGSWRALLPGVLFLAAYGAWRLGQPNWACLLATRTSQAGLVLGRTANEGRKRFTELVNWVSETQSPLAGVEDLGTVRLTSHDLKGSKPYTQAIHGAAFVCGALGWILIATDSPFLLGLAFLVLTMYYFLVAAAYLAQGVLDFPFAVKSAAVMSQISAVISLLVLLSGASWLGSLRFYFLLWGGPMAYLAGISAVAFSLYGIAAMTLATAGIASPRTARRSVLGLEG